jgi:ankyrin repeat protein
MTASRLETAVLTAIILSVAAAAPDAKTKTPLIDAIKTKKLAKVEQVLQNGGNPDEQDSKGVSALGHAARLQGCLAPITALVLSRVTAPDSIPDKHTCLGEWLLMAAAKGSTGTVGVLLSKGAPIDYRQDVWSQPVTMNFQAQTQGGGVATSQYSGPILSKGPSALKYAVANGHIETARLLLDRGAVPKWHDLEPACAAGNLQILRLFMDRPGDDGWMGCSEAAIASLNPEVLTLALTKAPGVYSDMIAPAEKTNNPEIIAILISQIREGRRQLHAAIESGDLKMVTLLVTYPHSVMVVVDDVELARARGNNEMAAILERREKDQINRQLVSAVAKYGIK